MIRKIYLYLFISALSFTKLTLATELMISDEFQSFSKSIYNNLSSVEEAREQLYQNGNLQPFLSEVKSVIEAVPELINYFGFRLLHNHSTLDEEEIMLETCEEFEDHKLALITSPTKFNKDEHYPASWILNNNRSYAFEYSTDESVKEGLKILTSALSVIPRIAELENKYNLQALLAPALIARKGFQSENKHAIFVESTQTEPTFKSIVTQEYSDMSDRNDLIQTSWAVNPNLITLGCVRESYCQPMPHYSHPRLTRHKKTK